jgi:hypothetical protein
MCMDLDVDVDVNVLDLDVDMDKLYRWVSIYSVGFEIPAVELIVFCVCNFFKKLE